MQPKGKSCEKQQNPQVQFYRKAKARKDRAAGLWENRAGGGLRVLGLPGHGHCPASMRQALALPAASEP